MGFNCKIISPEHFKTKYSKTEIIIQISDFFFFLKMVLSFLLFNALMIGFVDHEEEMVCHGDGSALPQGRN